MTKTQFQNRFKKIYPKGSRLLAIHLNGFSHSVFYDQGHASDRVIREEWSGCAPELNFPPCARDLFNGIGHAQYQNNSKEILYVLPERR